ncbi:unnamed protein product [Acanthoscelides obtectus]|uniref:Uncharacterized protein n=1 Tax=Acanthoscelides obtectus TaxID=200917 RepID=A0A9P0PG49_ACAOB|nr:unnamed protein product [Acanthoscelides obtectus]CAK1641945.1 hypothetical protein AOBTE_LOCUS12745 [Acanthoscelides obtectus]
MADATLMPFMPRRVNHKSASPADSCQFSIIPPSARYLTVFICFHLREKDELQLPPWVICMKVLNNDSMRPIRLEMHLKKQHPALVLKTKVFFSSEAESLKQMLLDKSESYHTAAGTTSEDIFNSISNFVENNDLDWKKFIGLCTDGSPAMIGVRSGLAKKLKEKILQWIVHIVLFIGKLWLSKHCHINYARLSL